MCLQSASVLIMLRRLFLFGDFDDLLSCANKTINHTLIMLKIFNQSMQSTFRLSKTMVLSMSCVVLLQETLRALNTQSAVWIDSVTHTHRHLHEHAEVE